MTFEGNFGNFSLSIFSSNPNLTTIIYFEGTTGWPQGFSNGSTTIVTTPIDGAGLSYTVINATDVEVTGRVWGNTDTDIVIPDIVVDSSGTTYSVTSIGGVAFGRNPWGSIHPALISVTIPNSVTNIGNSAFYLNALTSVTIPDSVTIIRANSFGYNALTSVAIPSSVTIIGERAFSNNALTSVFFEGNFGNFDLSIFSSNPNLTTITYCEGTTGWPQGFSNGSTTIVTEPIECSPPLAPSAPEFTGIITSNGQASVSVSVADDGGSPITEYTVLCVNANLLGFGNTSPTSPITISGLTNGETYACRATATNDVGTSPVSEASAPFTLATPPSMPQITGIIPGNGQASVSFTPWRRQWLADYELHRFVRQRRY